MMKRTMAILALAALLAGCRSWARATGDFKVEIPGDERAIDVNAGRATIRLLNRGKCPVLVRIGEDQYLLNTTDDKELTMAGANVLHLERRGPGEALIEVHFQAEGRVNTVNLR